MKKINYIADLDLEKERGTTNRPLTPSGRCPDFARGLLPSKDPFWPSSATSPHPSDAAAGSRANSDQAIALGSSGLGMEWGQAGGRLRPAGQFLRETRGSARQKKVSFWIEAAP